MRFRHSISYDAGPEEVHQMLADPDFREAVCAKQGAVDHRVAVEGSGSGMTVEVDQTLAVHGLPSFAHKFVGDQIQIRQREAWMSQSLADVDLTIPGKPGQLRAALRLDADGAGGTTETIDGEIKVPIPLIGGKLESLVAQMFADGLDAEAEVGAAWLAEG